MTPPTILQCNPHVCEGASTMRCALHRRARCVDGVRVFCARARPMSFNGTLVHSSYLGGNGRASHALAENGSPDGSETTKEPAVSRPASRHGVIRARHGHDGTVTRRDQAYECRPKGRTTPSLGRRRAGKRTTPEPTFRVGKRHQRRGQRPWHGLCSPRQHDPKTHSGFDGR